MDDQEKYQARDQQCHRAARGIASGLRAQLALPEDLPPPLRNLLRALEKAESARPE